jgi:hypothetical protein
MCWGGLGCLQELAGKRWRPGPAHQLQVYNSVVMYHCVLQKQSPPIVAVLPRWCQHPKCCCADNCYKHTCVIDGWLRQLHVVRARRSSTRIIWPCHCGVQHATCMRKDFCLRCFVVVQLLLSFWCAQRATGTHCVQMHNDDAFCS